MNKMLIKSAFAAVMLFATAGLAAAQTYQCAFTYWHDDSGSTGKEKMNLIFTVDLAANKATFTGNLGTSEVDFVNGVFGMSFIEETGFGNIMLTTIEHESGKAVHSRHYLDIWGTLYSQRYGKCVQEE